MEFTEIILHYLKLPSLPKKAFKPPVYDDALHIAIKNNPALKIIAMRKRQLAIKENYNNLSKFPKFDINLYGLYDLKYKEGYKMTFKIAMPLQRNAYKGEKTALNKQKLLLESQKKSYIKELQSALKITLKQTETQNSIIELAKKELLLKKRLEEAQRRQYFLGSSTLLLLNQREVATLQAEQKLLQAYYKLIERKLELRYILREAF